jgi:GTP-binding protein
MIVRSATFVGSSASLSGCPKPTLPEFAFIGRSNVGKSSLINMVVQRRSLAKTSTRPGKTQTINHFLVNEAWYLVDLPGYGYASVGKRTSKTWPKMIASYLLERSTLVNTFVLIDCRLEPQAIDREFITWAGKSSIPFSIVFTKTDKLSKSAFAKTADLWSRELRRTWSDLPPIFATSATTRQGREELLDYIEKSLAVRPIQDL